MTITRQVSDISESHKSQQQLPTSGTGVGLLWLLESQGLSVGGRAIYRLRGAGLPRRRRGGPGRWRAAATSWQGVGGGNCDLGGEF